MTAPPPSISILIPCFDARATIDACLASIARETGSDGGPALETIVIDDASRDGTADHVAGAFPWVRLVRLERNVGADGARNEGARIARGEVLAFIDADCELLPGWRAALERRLAEGARVLMGRVEPPRTFAQRAFALLELGEFTGPREGRIAALATLNCALRADLLRSYGGFDAALRTCGDRALSWRLHRDGVPMVYAPDVAVRHTPEIGTWPRVAARRERYAASFVKLRRKDPTLPGTTLLALGPLGAVLAALARLGKDWARLVAARRPFGLEGPHVLLALGIALAGLRLVDAAYLVAALRKGGRVAIKRPAPRTPSSR